MFKGGSFRNKPSDHPGKVGSTGSKTPPASTPKEKGSAPHGDVGEKHITETHPGKTQPHPVTGVHAFNGMHKGGGKYESHTHHDGGDVEVRQHGSAGEMHSAQQEALPDEGGQENDPRNGQQDFSEDLGGIGGDLQG